MSTWNEVGEDGPDRPLSPSAIKMYMRCPKQYEYRYIMGITRKPEFRMVFGSSVHKGLETNYKHKYHKKKDLPVQDVQDAFVDDFKKRVKDEDVKLAKPDMGKAVDEGVTILERYQSDVAPHVQPVQLPEIELIAEVPGLTRKLRGFVDLIADVRSMAGSWVKNVVRDTKTTTRMFTQEQADTDVQLTIYAYLLRAMKKIMPSKVQFDVILRARAGGRPLGPGFKTVTSTRTAGHFKRLEGQIQAVDRAIKAGVFYPTDNHQTCSWCGYAEMCHKGRSWAVRS